MRTRCRTSVGAAGLAGLSALAAALLASAGLPEPRARFVVHDHRTGGDGWHIEMTVAKDNRYLRQLVLHSERCDETVLSSRVRIRDDGTIASAKPFTTTEDAQGTWRLDATWTDKERVKGSFQITTPDCDGGVGTFSGSTAAPSSPT